MGKKNLPGFAISCVGIMICLVFSGCASGRPLSSGADSITETSGTASAADSAGRTNPTASSPAEKKTLRAELPQGAEVVNLSANGSRLLITYRVDQEYTISMFDTEKNTTREVLSTGDPSGGAFLESGDYYVLDSVSRGMTVYDRADDSVRHVYTMSRHGIPDQDGKGIWDAEDLKLSDDNGNVNHYISHVRYEQGNEEAAGASAPETASEAAGTASGAGEQAMPDAVFKLIHADGPYLYYRYAKIGYAAPAGPSDYRSTTCRLNRETSETVQYDDWIKGEDKPYGHESKLYHSEILIPWEDPGKLYIVRDADILTASGPLMLLKNEDTLQLADADTSRLLLEIPAPSVPSEQVLSAISREGGFFAVSDGGGVTVYRWEGEGIPVSNIEECRMEDLGSRIQDATKELSDRYGVTITDEKMITEEFQPQPLTSDIRKYAALLELGAVLGYFPGHMTEEIKPEGTDSFPICLAGDMSTSGLTSTIAQDGKFYMAFSLGAAYDETGDLIPSDKEDSLGDTVIHEMMHAIGMRLNTVKFRGKSVMSLWDSMVPPGSTDDAYQDTYGEAWVGQYTLDDPTAAKDDIWFEDAYARTMPEEDRAEIFKSLFLGVHDNGESWDADYPNLLKKGRLLCAMIRYAFPSVRATPAGSMYWERNFGQVSLDTFIHETLFWINTRKSVFF